MALMPEDAPTWLRLAIDLTAGAGAGALGAVARELGRTDREVSWVLIPLCLGGMALGSGMFVVTAAMGIEDDWTRFAVSFLCGTLGQAALTDLLRTWLRVLLRAPNDPPAPPPEGRP
jgi:hypothetical protein